MNNNNNIRKMSIGRNYDGDDVMHYVLGKHAYGGYHIHEMRKLAGGEYDIWIKHKSSGEVIIWKHMNKFVAVTVEYSLEY
ncbi:MAG: hypothetical protein K0U41_00480 [Gammaproteobacteria bacterium]|nr:hypothetical protein [Gammaproteobacteria bacterium]